MVSRFLSLIDAVMVSSFFCNRCRDGVYNFLRCQELTKEKMALGKVAKNLLLKLKKTEKERDQAEAEAEKAREEGRDFKRRNEACLLHWFGSKSV